MLTQSLMLVGFIVFIAILLLLFFVSRYKRCPSDKILVVYGRTGGEQSAQCYAGGAAFVWPVIQDYQYLDLTPISIDVALTDALSKQNIRVSVPAQFTVGVSNKPAIMIAAAERLLGLDQPKIRSLSHDIIMGQMRLVIANMDIEELNTDRDKFVDSVYKNVGNELHKIGLELINVNVTDIQDESGYIQALGQEAAAKAINEAKVKVANEERTGAIGQAEAAQDKKTKVAEAVSRGEVGEATANAKATEGKNKQLALIAESDAELAQRTSEADKKAEVARKVAKAQAETESYKAQEEAFKAKGLADLAEKRAIEVVESEVDKEKAVIAANAQKQVAETQAEGEANSILVKKKAEAEGIRLVQEATAEGIEKQVKAAGGADKLATLLLIEKLVPLQQINAEAMKNINIGDVTVIGDSSTAPKFVSDFAGKFLGLEKVLETMPMGKKLLNLVPEHTNGSPSKETDQVENGTLATEAEKEA